MRSRHRVMIPSGCAIAPAACYSRAALAAPTFTAAAAPPPLTAATAAPPKRDVVVAACSVC